MEFFTVDELIEMTEAHAKKLLFIQENFENVGGMTKIACSEMTFAEYSMFEAAKFLFDRIKETPLTEKQSEGVVLAVANQLNLLLLCGFDARKITIKESKKYAVQTQALHKAQKDLEDAINKAKPIETPDDDPWVV